MVPKEMVPRVLFEYHDTKLSRHPGMDETLRRVQENFYWDTMRIDVRDRVRSCRLCACCKPRRRRYKTHQRPRLPQYSWETIAVDLIGPYPRTRNGKENLLVVTDLFSRWVEAFPLDSATAGKSPVHSLRQWTTV